MCTLYSSSKDIHTARRPLYVFKVVRSAARHQNFWYSAIFPKFRSVQKGYENQVSNSDTLLRTGSQLVYSLGNATQSNLPETPGLYCYTNKEDAMRLRSKTQTVLECKIPSGTKFILGLNEHLDNLSPVSVIQASVLIPERVIYHGEEL